MPSSSVPQQCFLVRDVGHSHKRIPGQAEPALWHSELVLYGAASRCTADARIEPTRQMLRICHAPSDPNLRICKSCHQFLARLVKNWKVISPCCHSIRAEKSMRPRHNGTFRARWCRKCRKKELAKGRKAKTAPSDATVRPLSKRGQYGRSLRAPRDSKWQGVCGQETRCSEDCTKVHIAELDTTEVLDGRQLMELLQQKTCEKHPNIRMRISRTKVLFWGDRVVDLVCPTCGLTETWRNQRPLPERQGWVPKSSNAVPARDNVTIPARPNVATIQHCSAEDARKLQLSGGRIGLARQEPIKRPAPEMVVYAGDSAAAAALQRGTASKKWKGTSGKRNTGQISGQAAFSEIRQLQEQHKKDGIPQEVHDPKTKTRIDLSNAAADQQRQAHAIILKWVAQNIKA